MHAHAIEGTLFYFFLYLVLIVYYTHFFSSNDAAIEGLKKVTKGLYDIAACSLKNRDDLPIQELIIDDFDEEQIWQVSVIDSTDNLVTRYAKSSSLKETVHLSNM